MLTSGVASNGFTPSIQYQAWLSRPAFGPPSSTQAKAPRKGGVTKEARISVRKKRLPGRSVRATSHAIGAAHARQMTPTAAEVQSVVHSGLRKAGSFASRCQCAKVSCLVSELRLVT